MVEVVSGGNGNDWSYETCKAPVKSSPTNQHTNIFTGRMTVKISDTASIANFHHLNQSSEGLRERIEYIPQL